ncbi:predicted protein [Streptomyces filamentosus NRRL 15998]|uniref:Predicted protein n=1 Tax=Streptomyces filamentosus NRRL 15998 TaxID=457431 RepID=D6ATP2_STRFL|nr:predicted protein [Streptomyces filamentosus NRRL 15998]
MNVSTHNGSARNTPPIQEECPIPDVLQQLLVRLLTTSLPRTGYAGRAGRVIQGKHIQDDDWPSWRLLRRARCSTRRIGTIVQAVHTLLACNYSG